MGIIKKIALVVLIILLTAKIVLSAGLFLHSKNTGNESAIDVSKLIQMTNDYRLSRGLSSLNINPRLTQAAVNKAQDLLAKDYFSHTSPQGKRFSEWIKEVNYQYFYVGENLAIDFADNEDLFEAWLESRSHRENIVRPQYQEIGMTALSGDFNGRETTVVVQVFG
ncbi:MAG: CAP domain-containing protein, partial [Patescibacteria group bacterium]